MAKKKNKKETNIDINKYFLGKINRIPPYIFNCNIINVEKRTMDNFVRNSTIEGLENLFTKSSEYISAFNNYKEVFKNINFQNIKFPFNKFTIDFKEKFQLVRTFTNLELNGNILTVNTFIKESKILDNNEGIKETIDHAFTGSIDITTNKFFNIKIIGNKKTRSNFAALKTSSSKLKFLEMHVIRAFIMTYTLVASINEYLDVPKVKVYKIKSKKYKKSIKKNSYIDNSERVIDMSKSNKSYIYLEKSTEEKRNYNYSVESFSRRGYWRTYKSGKKVWIEPTTVNPNGHKSKDIKVHEYKI